MDRDESLRKAIVDRDESLRKAIVDRDESLRTAMTAGFEELRAELRSQRNMFLGAFIVTWGAMLVGFIGILTMSS